MFELPNKETAMKTGTTVFGIIFALIIFLSAFAMNNSVAFAGNRCKDHCNDAYHLRKDLCREIPLKHERHSCEDAAKHAKDNCKHRCR